MHEKWSHLNTFRVVGLVSCQHLLTGSPFHSRPEKAPLDPGLLGSFLVFLFLSVFLSSF